MDVSETELQALYTWVDGIPLSRPKKSIARDFADGVLLAEVVHHFFPRLVELHNYSAAHGLAQKLYNWNTLNQKVFRRLGFLLAKSECEAAATCEPGAVERTLKLVRVKLAAYAEQQEEAAAGAAQVGGFLIGSWQPQPLQPRGLPASRGFMDTSSELRAELDATGAQEPSAAESRPAAPQPGVAGSPTAHVTLHAKSPAKGARLPAGYEKPGARSERDEQLLELKEANEILTAKSQKLEQLVRLKEAKIQALTSKLAAAGLA